jgi:spore coat protein A
VPLGLFDRDVRRDGQLGYPVSADPEHPWVPEFFGETQLVNGKIFPYLKIEPRKYRFRVLNAANGRFYRLSVSAGAEILQIGSDQGLLPAPLKATNLQLAPGERADIVVDFAAHRGAKIVLQSDSFVLMQFKVGAVKVPDPSALPASLRAVPRIFESSALQTRRLTLDESVNNVAESTGMLLNNTPWRMPGRFVWHCHILEHEDNEMMRPYEITSSAGG